jgi:two-component system, NtrC family, sensor histidine kinase HydH
VKPRLRVRSPVMETLLEELKRYVLWNASDEEALRALHPLALPELTRISAVFYQRILDHVEARKALEGGESQVGRLKITLVAWMDTLLSGPWDEDYYERRAKIGRVHVRIALPQHYMFGAMNVVRRELGLIVDRLPAAGQSSTRIALGKILDLELGIMLHTYREDLIAQQARTERLATFGQLVGSIGHELRNPLGVIESSLYILRGRVSDERGLKHVDRIGEQLTIANQIITDLLDMIRDRPLDRARIRLDELAAALLPAIKRPAEVEIHVEGLAALPEIAADASKLRQVLVNLLDNAVHAVGASGQVWLRGVLTGTDLQLSVEDSGPGVDASIRTRLFEPLMSTKAKGIGLGLPLVRRIVERHGGTVAYEPARTGGARFVIHLPMG